MKKLINQVFELVGSLQKLDVAAKNHKAFATTMSDEISRMLAGAEDAISSRYGVIDTYIPTKKDYLPGAEDANRLINKTIKKDYLPGAEDGLVKKQNVGGIKDAHRNLLALRKDISDTAKEEVKRKKAHKEAEEFVKGSFDKWNWMQAEKAQKEVEKSVRETSKKFNINDYTIY